jgi:hypothetical protein
MQALMWSAAELPSFIRLHFQSVWALEIMLLLRREPCRWWPVDDIVADLRASRMLVLANLERFERGGLVIPDHQQKYRFSPATPAAVELCDALAAAYRERPVATINLIAAPEERLQQLADAFRLGTPAPKRRPTR